MKAVEEAASVSLLMDCCCRFRETVGPVNGSGSCSCRQLHLSHPASGGQAAWKKQRESHVGAASGPFGLLKDWHDAFGRLRGATIVDDLMYG